MKLEQRLLRDTQRAIKDFDMIQDWDTIILGVSGWKDSMFLWYALSQLQKRMKNKFKVIWVYIFKEFLIDCDIRFEEKRKYYEDELGISLEKINLKLPEDSKLNEWLGQSCQWCACARRVAMMKLCQKHWATKIAFGHHMDDIVVTTFMNMTQGRKLKIMAPINQMRNWKITFIRPLAYTREKDILRFCNDNNVPYSPCNCPVWETTMRNKIKKEIVWPNEKIIKWYTENIFWALIKDFREKYEHKNYMS